MRMERPAWCIFVETTQEPVALIALDSTYIAERRAQRTDGSALTGAYAPAYDDQWSIPHRKSILADAADTSAGSEYTPLRSSVHCARAPGAERQEHDDPGEQHDGGRPA